MSLGELNNVEPPSAAEAIPSLTELSDSALLGLWARTMDELRTRGVIRPANNPVADLAEGLVAFHLGLTLASQSTAAYDAVAPDGTHYQIKARRRGSERASRQLGAIRNLDQDGFDYLVVVLFHRDFTVEAMWRMPIDLVREHAKYRAHVSRYVLQMRGSVLADPRAERLD